MLIAENIMENHHSSVEACSLSQSRNPTVECALRISRYLYEVSKYVVGQNETRGKGLVHDVDDVVEDSLRRPQSL